ncbi:MAG: beta-lactamase family protein, partial [Deltaproteobacteria bacterium]|nr:beta-lactamase family protein [Kofleriaceae bacterium]
AVVALAHRKGATWYVALVDGKEAAFDRRGAQLGTAIDSFTVPGVEKESFAGKTAHPLDAARLAELETFIEEARVATGVPGVAIAIVQGGKIVYEKGFGVRELGKKAAVTPNTRFIIGSIGKSLTTLMTARLVDAGKLGWDTPVVEVLPSFALGDEATTRAARMRHTSCACTGMPRQDLEFVFEGNTTEEARLASMATMKPTTKFGETFQYANLMVAAGGFAAAHAYAPKLKLGPAYDKAMRELVFEPLGMKASTYDFKAVARTEHAKPHPTDAYGKPTPVAITDELWVHPIRPAGGLWSTVHDMARVLLLELGRGKLDGKQLVGEAALLARREPQVKISDDESYGLGLVVSRSLGITMIEHGGATGGFGSSMFFLPDHDVGVIVLTNKGGGGLLAGAVTRRLLELLFDGRPEAATDLASALANQETARAEQLKRIEAPPPADWFAPLAGTWSAPGLGTIVLRTDKKAAVLDAGEWKVTVGKKTELDGTVKLVSVSGLAVGVELIPREQDGATVLVLEDYQREYVFTKTK